MGTQKTDKTQNKSECICMEKEIQQKKRKNPGLLYSTIEWCEQATHFTRNPNKFYAFSLLVKVVNRRVAQLLIA